MKPILIMALLSLPLIASEPPAPKGMRLKDIVAEHYPDGNVYIGGTTGWMKRQKESGIILDREFSYVTPENDFKQHTVHPSPGKWNWKHADAWVKHCADKHQVLRIHGPISPQCSRWAMEDDRSPAELKQNLEEYMTALCKRYDPHPHVKWMDVVNETVSSKGRWLGPNPGVDKWQNPWPIIGYDESDPLRPPLYIKMAFEIANQHAPNTKLIINQHGSMEKPMWDKVKATVHYLRKQGLRVDGIGWQAHVDLGWEKEKDNLESFRNLIDWAHANQLSFHVTENNVWLKNRKKDYETQAKTFACILRVLLEKRHSGVVTWNVWNLSDANSWRPMKPFKGCLFDDNYGPKPAYYAIQRELLNAAK